ncbi:hypothetical protein [Rufibacter aurantiacus]|uniref:hypothetical protein n=1 Tax=Rufibacter aurantiacus TaxID=2817374 RepID=UPI001B318635|nr:hypothetical protein [Rufibacter aurantiacus]
MKHFSVLFLLLFASLQYSFAQEGEQLKLPYQPVRLLLGGAFEFGGDKVAQVYFTNGDDQSVHAGQGISVAVGGEFQVPKVERLLLRTTVGFKYVTTQADNAHIRLTRFPIHVTANWMATNKIRLGAGLATHQGINFKADGIGEDIEFKGATGPTFEVAYGPVGITYTAMTYKNNSNQSYSANAVGIAFSFVIPRR